MSIAKKELKRLLLNLGFGVIIVILLYFDLLNKISFSVVIIAAIAVSMVSKRKKIPGIYWFLEKFERETDLIHFPGKSALLYLISSFVVFLLFEKDIAMASILILALGNSISHLVGRFGSMKHPFTDNKFLEGFIAGLILAFIGAYVILNNALEAGLGAFIAMLVEGFEVKFKGKKIDDNLMIPIVAGVVIWIVRLIF